MQQLAIHTIDGVLTPAEKVMKIVPDQRHLEVEAWVKNRDIGFVKAGQTVVVKFKAFPFTEYGTTHGHIETLSDDAIADPKRGLVYEADVALNRATMEINGKSVHLTPGMQATAEVKTGSRHVIQHLLSPLIRDTNGSLHER